MLRSLYRGSSPSLAKLCLATAALRPALHFHSSSASRSRERDGPRYNYNPNPFGSDEVPEEAQHYPFLNTADLSQYHEPPRKVRLLSRDFIEDSLYNPHYGYFSTQVEILNTDKSRGPFVSSGIDFGRLRNTLAFEEEVSKKYEQGEKGAEESMRGAARQVWHTPTELFKPWYARAIARYIVATHLESGIKDRPLRIFEIGAGNGTLMTGVLDTLRDIHPEVYAAASYTTIEVSARLAGIQRTAAQLRGHQHHARALQKSAFSLSEAEGYADDCFVLATEVLDNLSHDVVRYLPRQMTPLQGLVSVDGTGDFSEVFSPVSDPLLHRFLALRAKLGRRHASPPQLSTLEAWSPLWRSIKLNMPFAPNLTKPEFVPTRMLELLEVLRDRFPQHRLVISDFASLPDAIEGANAPVVQTRYQGVTVPCTTYLVSPGFFDIFFPTDFALLRDLHSAIMPAGSAPLDIVSHSDFLRKWGEPEQTRCRDGSNPMLDYYENVKFAVSSR